MLPQILKWFPEGDHVFRLDGTPFHRMSSIPRLLAVNNIQVLPWPINSVGLNPPRRKRLENRQITGSEKS